MISATPTAAPSDWELVSSRLAMGVAVCPKCLLTHVEAGRMHLEKPMSMTPRCKDCSEPLLMPWRMERK